MTSTVSRIRKQVSINPRAKKRDQFFIVRVRGRSIIGLKSYPLKDFDIYNANPDAYVAKQSGFRSVDAYRKAVLRWQ